MIYSSLAVLALSASAVVNPFTNRVHMHPSTNHSDNRVSLVLYNNTSGFCDVSVDGHIYTVLQHHSLSIKAPAGTVVYAASPTLNHRRGEALLEVNPELNLQTVNIK
jgi:hypothetical protein